MRELKCYECGQPIDSKMTTCPNCGAPLDGYQYETNQDVNQKKANFSSIVIGLIVLALCGIITLVALWPKDNNANKFVPIVHKAAVVEIPLDQKIRNAKTAAEVRKLIDGTTWHHTKNLHESKIGCWIKVKFENGKYTSYYAAPNDGKWTKSVTGKYKIKEDRFADSGEKYISVEWKGDLKADFVTLPCEFSLVTNNFQLDVFSSFADGLNNFMYGSYYNAINGRTHYVDSMEFGDYFWQ